MRGSQGIPFVILFVFQFSFLKNRGDLTPDSQSKTPGSHQACSMPRACLCAWVSPWAWALLHRASAETRVGGNEASLSPHSQLSGDKTYTSITSCFVFFLLIYFKLEWASLVAQSVKSPPAKQVDLGSIPGSGRSPGEGNGNPLQHSCPENPLDRGAWRATVYGVAKELDTT